MPVVGARAMSSPMRAGPSPDDGIHRGDIEVAPDHRVERHLGVRADPQGYLASCPLIAPPGKFGMLWTFT